MEKFVRIGFASLAFLSTLATMPSSFASQLADTASQGSAQPAPILGALLGNGVDAFGISLLAPSEALNTPQIINTALLSYASEGSRRSADFLDSLGINTDMASPAPSCNVNSAVNDLAYTGFKHVRGTIGSFSATRSNLYYTNGKWVMPPSFNSVGEPIPGGNCGKNAISSDQMLTMFASIGVHIDPTVYLNDPRPNQSWLDAHVAMMDYIEGPNEVNLNKTGSFDNLTGIPAGVAVQKSLYQMVKSDSKLSKIPVLALTIGDTSAANSSESSVGDMANYADYGNIHPYPYNGSPPYSIFAKDIAVTTYTPGKPFVVTETGYPTAVNGPKIHTVDSVSEDVQAKYLLSDVFDAFNQGIIKTYIYQLIDYQCDPYFTNGEMHYGLFRCDNTPKPAAVAFHNLQAILHDGSANASSFTPEPLSYSITQWLTNSPSDVRKFHTLLQKADGTYELVLWGEPSLWNNASHVQISTGLPTNLVTINFARTYQSIKVYDPLRGSTPTLQVFNTNQIKITVVDHPLIVEIGPTPASGS